MNEAQKFLIDHGINDRFHLMTKNDLGYPIVDGMPSYTSDLMKYWAKAKHDQSHALLKEAYEAIVFMWYHLETNTMTNNQLKELEVKFNKAEQWLKENR